MWRTCDARRRIRGQRPRAGRDPWRASGTARPSRLRRTDGRKQPMGAGRWRPRTPYRHGTTQPLARRCDTTRHDVMRSEAAKRQRIIHRAASPCRAARGSNQSPTERQPLQNGPSSG